MLQQQLLCARFAAHHMSPASKQHGLNATPNKSCCTARQLQRITLLITSGTKSVQLEVRLLVPEQEGMLEQVTLSLLLKFMHGAYYQRRKRYTHDVGDAILDELGNHSI
jgi:hypothetical protein